VKNELQENEDQFYWEDKTGKKCLKIVFNRNDNRVLGVNVFGIRLRQELFDHWIKNKTHIHTVILELGKANFDPEFSTNFKTATARKFEAQIV